MRSAGKTTRKHRRQQANGKPRHKLIGGRTGGKATHQLKNFKRGKASKAIGRARNELVCKRRNPLTASARSFRVAA